ncbi:rhodanese-like domain-containing protein [Rubellimicrobium roseum]|uniref:Rhodanese-like domain-containing protein n=1 Tax=Rubellimicrobium roseum TaxID=687525 RepID=A0A5C4N603_9RHOB|nr:rhodanese-like domain-containing protein [Rubellimicrobium roseum]TNC65371.1 rhodanese-like domain-containing protein [Rubellimicrobium roseum]
MARTAAEMVAEAKSKVRTITPEEVSRMDNVLVVDVRDAPEVAASGKVPGAVHVPRGMLEFRADPTSPYHDKNFDPARPVVLYCASGGRSALAGAMLQEMGYTDVRNMGGFKEWSEKGLPIET